MGLQQSSWLRRNVSSVGGVPRARAGWQGVVLAVGCLAAAGAHANLGPEASPLSGTGLAPLTLAAPASPEAPVPSEALGTPVANLASPALAQELAGTKRVAQALAVGDSVSTHLALLAGGAEANPLVSTSPLGLAALAGMKLLLLNHIDKYPEERRVALQRNMSSFWGGLTANNLLMAAGAASGLALPAGLLAGLMIYKSDKFEQAESMALAKAKLEPGPRNARPAYDVVTQLRVRLAAKDGSYDPQASLTTIQVKTSTPLPENVAAYFHPNGKKYFIER